MSEFRPDSQTNPVVADAAPRLCLAVDAGKPDERRIVCRRVVTLLGRRSGCKLVMQHRQVSPVHVAIVNDGAHIYAADLVTSSGTLLNGLKLEHERLSDGDMLACSPWEFRVDIEPPSHSGNGDAHPFGLEPAPHVVALEHVATGRLLKPERDVCTIGRLNGCDITISDNEVSRAHALLLTYFGRPALFDLLSSNQTMVNDQPTQFRFLANDDIITIGDTVFKARLLDSPVVERAGGNHKPAQAGSEPNPSPCDADAIDIHATESSQRWRIAEKAEKASRKR